MEQISEKAERLENAIKNESFDELSRKEIVKTVLSYFVSDTDTELAAERIFERFGSVSCAMETDDEFIFEVLDRKQAELFKAIPLISAYCKAEKLHMGKPVSSLTEIAEYCLGRITDDNRELFFVILLDCAMRIIGVERIGEGENDVRVDMQLLARAIFDSGASSYVLVHNHPAGELVPSDNDIQLTERVQRLFGEFDKTLTEHLIISGDCYVPVLKFIEDSRKPYIWGI